MNRLVSSDVAEVSIAQIEDAINVWRNRNPSMFESDVLVLCAEARCLANLYGRMIFLRETDVPREALNEAQLAALAGAQT
ncbi:MULTISPECIES: DUF3717 domain-containing protein [Paraburkholderia]|jgi:Protein of unknown function (DUF3717)|uniref:DUF3717 domain-containing protein n=1 Tax=Paraburkholderia fungorum TaxID=134537 RepID=A0AAP5QJG8_9BURK|nr:DUF3717 domain-containing protein [Paraburkholderia fungorum]MDT8843755.1 DUF3717 domain-containing protein [Paraburkholderia fungorum]